jgi:hypothetical protein
MPLMVVWTCSAVVVPRPATIKRSLYRRIDLTNTRQMSFYCTLHSSVPPK